jgi:sulfatase maturation enzyme AslB (radical SAM superfamily)
MINLCLEINIVNHCNLSCKSCDHLAPLCNEYFYKLEELEGNFMYFSENTNNEDIKKVVLFGGEPLLHPELNKIVEMTRSMLHIRTFQLITNGILLDTISDELLSVFNKNDLGLVISDYHLKDLSQTYTRLDKHNIKYNVLDIDKFAQINLRHSTYQKRFDDHCGRLGNRCVCLSHGKIYHCGIAANSKALSNRFNEDFLITKNDFVYMNLVDKEDLLKFALYPSDFCTYCSFSDVKEFDYGPSELKKEEWISD